MQRRFPPPWSIEELNYEACFVTDSNYDLLAKQAEKVLSGSPTY